MVFVSDSGLFKQIKCLILNTHVINTIASCLDEAYHILSCSVLIRAHDLLASPVKSIYLPGKLIQSILRIYLLKAIVQSLPQHVLNK